MASPRELGVAYPRRAMPSRVRVSRASAFPECLRRRRRVLRVLTWLVAAPRIALGRSAYETDWPLRPRCVVAHRRGIEPRTLGFGDQADPRSRYSARASWKVGISAVSHELVGTREET